MRCGSWLLRSQALRSALLDDAAVEEADGAVGVGFVAGIVGHYADGGALAVEVAQDVSP